MPTITFSLKDLQQLVGRKLTVRQLEELAHYAKGELERYDPKTDELSLSLDDTNLPYLWSVEGISWLLKGVLGIRRGKLLLKDSGYSIVVDPALGGIRPFIGALVAKGKRLDDYLIRQYVQLQEKLAVSYGRKRQKISIGLYSYKRIRFPVFYKAVAPDSVSFVPLDSLRKMSLRQILSEHPKGREFGGILANAKRYPLLVDSRNEVLSFPPIINSNFTGKVEPGDEQLLLEVTGMDEESVNLAVSIFALAFAERGFDIYSVEVQYGGKSPRKVVTPSLAQQKIRISREQVEQLLGLKLSPAQIKALLERAGFGFHDFEVTVPPYRGDIMHPFDVVEDIGIMYGYSNIKPLPLTSYTIGGLRAETAFVDKCREIMIGMGFQEVMSHILSNKSVLYANMCAKDLGTAEIESFMSETYSVVRSWLLPMLMEVLSKNTHATYPQLLFEQGLATVRKGSEFSDYEKLAGVACHAEADFSEAKKYVDSFMKTLGVSCVYEPGKHSSFVPGRAAVASLNGSKVAILGEVSPAVLENWGLSMPVAAFEVNLSDLFHLFQETGRGAPGKR